MVWSTKENWKSDDVASVPGKKTERHKEFAKTSEKSCVNRRYRWKSDDKHLSPD